MKHFSGVALISLVSGPSSLVPASNAFVLNSSFSGTRGRRTITISHTNFKATVVSDGHDDGNIHDGDDDRIGLSKTVKTEREQPKVIYPFQDASMLLMHDRNKQMLKEGEQMQHSEISKIEASIRKVSTLRKTLTKLKDLSSF